MKSWKTTSTGITMCAGAIFMLVYEWGKLNPEVMMAALTAFLGGIGLIFAKDQNGENTQP